MGLGDTVILAGMVRALASQCQEVVLVIKKQYTKASTSLFQGVPNLKLLAVADDSDISPAFGSDGAVVREFVERGFEVLPLGLHSGVGMAAWASLHPCFAHRFYMQAGMDYRVSHTHFVLNRDPEREQALYDKVVARCGPDYVFLHEDRARGFCIDPSLVKTEWPIFDAHDPDITSDNLFDYCMVMEKAKELHFMDSCFGLLADRLPGLTCPMTCHAYARDNSTLKDQYAKPVSMVYKPVSDVVHGA